MDPVNAAWVTGRVRYAPTCDAPALEFVGDVRHEWGYRCSPRTWSSDDPRFGGPATITWNADVYRTGNGFDSVVSATWKIDGENGGWLCAAPNGLTQGYGLFATDVQGTERIVCAGDGSNEGLTAILTADWHASPRSFEGLIIEGSQPPAPSSEA